MTPTTRRACEEVVFQPARSRREAVSVLKRPIGRAGPAVSIVPRHRPMRDASFAVVAVLVTLAFVLLPARTAQAAFGYLGQFGSYGDGQGQFVQPTGVSVAADGSVYVVDTGNDRMQRFTSGHVYSGRWGSRAGRRASSCRRKGLQRLAVSPTSPIPGTTASRSSQPPIDSARG